MIDPSVFIHDQALCESETIGPRTRVWALAHVMKGASIGADCNICGFAFIESGVTIGDRVTVKNHVQLFDGVSIRDDVFIGPGVVFTNDPNPRAAFKKDPSQFLETLVENGASLGANSTILCGITIGANSFVGAGSVVTRSVPSHALVVGHPARQTGWMCVCGERLPNGLSCVCGRRYRFLSKVKGLEQIQAKT
jgi:acetyltransferase-like isoleucine patch superfamily enzyme